MISVFSFSCLFLEGTKQYTWLLSDKLFTVLVKKAPNSIVDLLCMLKFFFSLPSHVYPIVTRNDPKPNSKSTSTTSWGIPMETRKGHSTVGLILAVYRSFDGKMEVELHKSNKKTMLQN